MHPTSRPHRAPLRIAVVTTVAALALAACTSSHGSHPKASSTPSTSSTATSPAPTGSAASAAATSAAAAASAQIAKLLIKASDISIDKFTLTNSAPVNAIASDGTSVDGSSAVYANGNHQRVVSVIVIRYLSASDAQASAPEEQTVAAGELTRNPASDTPENVGQLAHLYQGANATGPLSILVFAEGRYVVTMEFISKTAGDSVPASVVLALGKKQDALLK